MNTKPFVVMLAGLLGIGVVFFSACGFGPPGSNTNTVTASPTPVVPAGIFPAEIAGYKSAGHPLASMVGDDKSVTSFAEFYWYSGKKIAYTAYSLGSAAAAKKFFEDIHDSAIDTYSAANTDDRRVHYHTADSGVDTQLLAGTYVVTLVAADVNDSLEFEAGIPYAAFGVAAPPKHTLADAKEQPRQGLDVLAEFRKSPKDFKAKYDGKPMFVAGKIAVTSKGTDGSPTLAIKPPGDSSDILNYLTLTFKPTNNLAAKLKAGDTVLCRGKVDADTDLGMLFINDCELL